MILEQGNKVFIVHRRLFVEDRVRFFAGIIDEYEGGVAKISGHTWIQDPTTDLFERKEDAQTKIVSIGSSALIVYQLPSEVELSCLKITRENDGRFFLADPGLEFRMDVTETDHILPRHHVAA